MTGTPALVAYLGWSGRGNLGDDAIQEAIGTGVPGVAFAPLPLYAAETLRFMLAPRGARRVRRAILVLGGGTVIGRSNWRVHLRVGLWLVPTRPARMIGAGVEDPDFQGRHSFSGGGELTRWAPLLRTFEAVTVRGPRSAELLADVGIEARVVGDPALLLGPPEGAPTVEPGLIGVNLGHGDDLWGHDQDDLVVRVARTLRELVAAGHTIRFLVANRDDLDTARSCAEQAGLGERPDVRLVTEPQVFLREVAQCEAFIGERLHAVVLATAAAVPSVMLEYQPKCLDFMRSVHRQEWSLRTDRVNPGILAAMVQDMVAARSKHALQIRDAVDLLRAPLETEIRALRTALEAA